GGGEVGWGGGGGAGGRGGGGGRMDGGFGRERNRDHGRGGAQGVVADRQAHAEFAASRHRGGRRRPRRRQVGEQARSLARGVDYGCDAPRRRRAHRAGGRDELSRVRGARPP